MINDTNDMLSQQVSMRKDSMRNMSIGVTKDIVKKTYRTLLIVFLTYTTFYMCFPSIIFLHFTQLGHYKQVIKSYADIEEDAARSFLTIYTFTILFGA